MSLGFSTEVFEELTTTLAMLGKWQEAARFAGNIVEEGQYTCRSTCQWALLSYAASDHAAYRACCAELLARHAATANSIDAARIATACIIGPNAVNDRQLVVKIAQMATDALPESPLHKTLVAVGRVRGAEGDEAIKALDISLKLVAAAEPASLPGLDQVRMLRLIGHSILTQAYRERGDTQTLASQIDLLRDLIRQLEVDPPRYNDGIDHWALPLALHVAKRDLAELEASTK
jgi:hypothetical protein